MTILKKTIFAGLAAITMASTMTVQAQASGCHRSGYAQNYYSCHYKKVWRTDYYGHRFLKTIKVCG